jgi:hypothetical protein
MHDMIPGFLIRPTFEGHRSRLLLKVTEVPSSRRHRVGTFRWPRLGLWKFIIDQFHLEISWNDFEDQENHPAAWCMAISVNCLSVKLLLVEWSVFGQIWYLAVNIVIWVYRCILTSSVWVRLNELRLHWFYPHNGLIILRLTWALPG